MEKQPAKLNYFFKGGYVELFNTIKSSFRKLGANIGDAFYDVIENFSEFWETFWPSIGGIIAFEADWDDLLTAVISICKFGFALGKLIFVTVITTGLTLLFSALHIMILIPVMLLAYVAFLVLLGIDSLYCTIKRISSNCSVCQHHFIFPVYLCPACGARHTCLRPSKYGIWTRTCECGEKIPTTFFNGRENLEAHCPNCNHVIENGGKHVEVCIPIVGGTSSGKTCFINSAIDQIQKIASENGLYYKYSPLGADDYETNIDNLKHGRLPDKTMDMKLRYYRFFLSPSDKSVMNLISLCDVGGEVYSDSASLGQQIGYRHANAFILVVDPLSVASFRREVAKTVHPAKYGGSNDAIDEVLNMLTTTLENMLNASSKDMLKMDVAVVFTKCDIPALKDKLSDAAVDAYMDSNPGTKRLDAQNAVCEKFLTDYDEVNFLNGLKSKFKTVQFFCCSSLGHNENGTPFVSTGVEEPVFWLLDRMPETSDLKGKFVH